MATWEDGPEYAPRQRPDDFAPATVATLPSATVQPLAAWSPAPVAPDLSPPTDRPLFSGPAEALAPLATLVPAVTETRDPARPFSVVSSTLTSMDSAWGAAHWNRSGNGPAGEHGQDGTAGSPPVPWGSPPVGTAWDAPSPVATAWTPAPGTPAAGAATPVFPSPGTPAWFGPGPGTASPPLPAPVTAGAVLAATTPGVWITLAIGGFVYLLAPITLCLAFAAGGRVAVARDQVRLTLFLAFMALGLVTFLGLLASVDSLWRLLGMSALVLSWASLVRILVLVRRGLRDGAAPAPAYRSPSTWG